MTACTIQSTNVLFSRKMKKNGDQTRLTSHVALDELVLGGCLDGDEVHAALPAVVPGVEPVPVGAPQSGVVALPAHPVEVVSKTLVARAVHS